MSNYGFISSLEKLKPFNISILKIDKSTIDQLNLKEIKSLDITDKTTGNFHPEGLFSVDIFGKPLSKSRSNVFAYIDLKLEVIHPLAYKLITKLSSLYEGILTGKKYAKFDKSLSDFVESDEEDAQTGYDFFYKHFKLLKIPKNNSKKRNFYIDFLEKNLDNLGMRYLLVMPAGLRDYTIDENNKPSENEINGLYRKIIYLTENLDRNVDVNNMYLLDTNRIYLQNAILNLYEFIISLLEGKHKLIQGKWAARNIYNSSRNVITPVILDFDNLDSEKNIDFNSTTVGLYQYIKIIFPLFFNNIKNNFFSHVFLDTSGNSKLIDKKTLKQVEVTLSPKIYDTFMDYNKFEDYFNTYFNLDMRRRKVVVEDYYIALIYEDDKEVRILTDIDQEPDLDKSKIRPIDYTELYYLYSYELTSRTPCFVTRYPIAGYGGIYPSMPYLKVTDKGKVVDVYDIYGFKKTTRAPEFPIGDIFYDSVAPSNSHIKRLSADFDGDTVSLTAVMMDESVEEIKNLLNSRKYYVNEAGEPLFSIVDDIVNLTISHLTSDVSQE